MTKFTVQIEAVDGSKITKHYKTEAKALAKLAYHVGVGEVDHMGWTISSDGVAKGKVIKTEEPEADDEDDEDDEDDGEAEASVALPRSVVKPGYKVRYIERAVAMSRKPKGVAMKALKRMSGDWLAIELAKLTLDPKSKLIVASFEAVLDANGVAHARWNRTSKGWQGRLRMTGRLALERVVASAGVLAVPNAEALPAPRAWVASHTR